MNLAPRNTNGVSPDRIRARAETQGASLPPLIVAAERVANTVAQGIHGRRRVGTGETFWQYRPYGAGDAANAIDWRRSARSDHLFVREMEWEAAQSVWLWRDGSASMAYASSKNLPTKRDRASLLLLATATLLLRGGERVGLIGGGFAPSVGRDTIARIAERLLYSDQENEEAVESAGPTRDLESLPPEERIARHGTAVLIGDFLSPAEEIEARIARFAERSVRGVLVQVLDPAEETLPFEGRTRFLGMEREGEMLIGRVERLRDAYTARFKAHRDRIGAAVRAAGWTMLVHHTDRSAEEGLMGLYMALSGETL